MESAGKQEGGMAPLDSPFIKTSGLKRAPFNSREAAFHSPCGSLISFLYHNRCSLITVGSLCIPGTTTSLSYFLANPISQLPLSDNLSVVLFFASSSSGNKTAAVIMMMRPFILMIYLFSRYPGCRGNMCRDAVSLHQGSSRSVRSTTS